MSISEPVLVFLPCTSSSLVPVMVSEALPRTSTFILRLTCKFRSLDALMLMSPTSGDKVVRLMLPC